MTLELHLLPTRVQIKKAYLFLFTIQAFFFLITYVLEKSQSFNLWQVEASLLRMLVTKYISTCLD